MAMLCLQTVSMLWQCTISKCIQASCGLSPFAARALRLVTQGSTSFAKAYRSCCHRHLVLYIIRLSCRACMRRSVQSPAYHCAYPVRPPEAAYVVCLPKVALSAQGGSLMSHHRRHWGP